MTPQMSEASRQRQALQARVRFLLDYRWGGSQREMARDLAVSQGLISKIINGLQGPGRRFLLALARQTGVNSQWVMDGVGQPLTLPSRGTLPITTGVLPGLPSEYANLFTGERHPVAEAFDRETRYWLELQSNSPLVANNALRFMAGDLLLLESDPAWTNRLDLILGRICGVRLQERLSEPTYELGRLCQKSDGVIFEIGAQVIRMAVPYIAPPIASPQPRSGETAPERRKRRTIRNLDNEEKKAAKRALVADQTESAVEPTFTLKDIVCACIYMTRPNPSCV